MTLPAEQRRTWIRSRREQRKLTRRARLRRQVLRYLMLAVLFVGGLSGFYYVPWALSSQGGAQIIVKGNKVVTDEQVRQSLSEAINKPIYELDPTQLEAKVRALAVVKEAFIRRYNLPTPRLVVEVLEEFPWASYGTTPDAEPEWVICESGKVIKIADFPKVIQPPLRIYGPPCLHLSSADVAQWATWIAQIEKQTKVAVDAVDLRDPLDAKVEDGDLYLKLGTADTTLTKRIGRLASVETAIEPIKGQIEYVDLGLDNNIPIKLAKKLDGRHSL
jgi:cell division septal protein FtsQ